MAREKIELLSKREIEKMHQAGRLAADLLHHLGEMVKPGISTQMLNDEAERYTKEHGAVSAPLGYGGPHNPFPRSICTSVNACICHGIPTEKEILKDGDIINIDVTPILNGYHGDTSKTFFVGTPADETKKLVEVTAEALRIGIAQVKPGGRVGDIGNAIEKYVKPLGYSIVEDFVGHGIGRTFHTAPQVHHFNYKRGRRFEPGMAFTIEPMINIGEKDAEMLDDGWTALTLDRSLSAQFEHTLVCTSEGCEIMTLREGESYP